MTTGATLLVNPPAVLFPHSEGILAGPNCSGVAAASAFCVMELPVARAVCMAVLLVVASGVWPRFTAIPHWWATFSLGASARVVDGGDHLAMVLTALLLPIALTDPRRWHWQAPPSDPAGELRLAGVIRVIVAASALVVLRVQMAGVYLHASIGKLGVDEWVNGTALYYWLRDGTFGSVSWLRPLTEAVTGPAWGTAVVTWGSIAVEFVLFLGLLLAPPYRRWLLILGIAFHAGIAVVMGLISFSAVMTAGLILFLRPAASIFSLPSKVAALARRLMSGKAIGDTPSTPPRGPLDPGREPEPTPDVTVML